MRPASAIPSGIERTFGDDELIVSKTDSKGVVRYANKTFLRMAAMTEEEVIGKPHNLIRHPGMPRCVFRLLWDRIGSGGELFGYILNLAADGAHYWVYAHVTPTFGPGRSIIGYHSSRRSPERAAVTQVTELYQRLCAEEARHSRPADAVAGSTALLQETLANHQLSYDQWVWQLTTSAGRQR